ncbi:DEAD/DEAH box helicase [Euryarchaeota archaeon]|nr:DEAD/DEAH box helicase [Euryarchaeota archaeon]
MEKIKLDFIPGGSPKARISIEDSETRLWSSLVGIFTDETEDIIYVSSNEIIIPWWVLLLKRTDMGELLKYYKVIRNFEISNSANEQILSSISNVQQYQQVLEVEKMPDEQLTMLLQSSGFTRELFDYQKDNVKSLISLPSGATFSVPGAGKTTEALAFYASKANANTKLLIVCPKNAFAVWEEEFANCFTDSSKSIVRLRGTESIRQILRSNPDIMLTTYSQFQIIPVRDLLAEYMSSHETIMFLDESHHMKRGLEGVRGRNLLGISIIPKNKLIMSGTPMPNSPEDLIAQFNFLYPEVDVNENNVIEHIQPIFVRTTKDDLNLPERNDDPIPIGMSDNQKRLYDIVRDEELLQLENLEHASQRARLRAFARCYIKLLQLASNPMLVSEDIQNAHPNLMRELLAEGPGKKIEWACNRARVLAAEDKKVIIWSSFVSNVELIATRLEDLGAVYIHGGVDAGSEDEQSSREGKIHNFKNNPNCKVLVANPAAAGEGISLHKVCLNAIYVDRTFNAAHYLQSIDRIHRLGLDEHEHPHIEILISEGSIDVDVDIRLTSKIQRMLQALNDSTIYPNPVTFDEEREIGDMDDGDMESILDHLG